MPEALLPRSRSSYHHGALREALLQAGRDALVSGSAEALSLRELSRSVGVTASAAYQHFKGRDELLEALALDGFLALKSALHAAIQHGPRSAPDRLGQAYLDFARQHPPLVALMFRPRPKGRGSRVALDEALGECLAEFVAALETGRAARAGDPTQVIQRAVASWAAVHGFAMLGACQAFGTLDEWMLPAAATLMSPGRREG